MPENSEEKFNIGLSVLEMTRTAGWQWLEKKIQQELEIERNDWYEYDPDDIDIQRIGSECLRRTITAHAYEKILLMVQSAIYGKDEAAEEMSNQSKN